MQFQSASRSLVAMIVIFAASSTASAGGRRSVVYVMPQQYVPAAAPFRHDDVLNELQTRAITGSRGLATETMMDINATLGRINNSAVVRREFRNQRAGGAIAAQIIFNVLNALQVIEASPTQLSGAQKTDSLIQALQPLVNQLLAANQVNTVPATTTTAAATPAADAELQPLIKLTEDLKAVQAALKQYEKEYEAELAKQKKLQEKRDELRDAAKAALKKVAEDLQKSSDMK